MSTTPVYRFAPTPNGDLHLGHALSAIVGFEAAKAANGRFLLRIEDIDPTRTREEYVQDIFDDLTWLGLSWEEPVLRQSSHFGLYIEATQKLQDMGLLYPCFASRSDILNAIGSEGHPIDPDGVPLYPFLHKNMPQDEFQRRKAYGAPFALRLDMERALDIAKQKTNGRPLTFVETGGEGGRSEIVEAHPEQWGDAIIVRKDTPATYMLAVVIDDALQGVTHVSRGLDLFAATDLQRLLQVLLDLAEPTYHHHRLIMDGNGRKLSKSERDTSLRSLRSAGATPADIRARIRWA